MYRNFKASLKFVDSYKEPQNIVMQTYDLANKESQYFLDCCTNIDLLLIKPFRMR